MFLFTIIYIYIGAHLGGLEAEDNFGALVSLVVDLYLAGVGCRV